MNSRVNNDHDNINQEQKNSNKKQDFVNKKYYWNGQNSECKKHREVMHQFKFRREHSGEIDTPTTKEMQLFEELTKIRSSFMINEGFFNQTNFKAFR